MTHTATGTIEELATTVTELGRLSMAFGQIERTAVYHADQTTRETDTTHTVMLALVGMALADTLYSGRLDCGLVAQFAVVHDLPEVYAGDTPTLRIDAAGRAGKAAREAAARRRIESEFAGPGALIPDLLGRYEEQVEPEARFVRLVDKILPKIVHQIDDCHGLIEHGMTPESLRVVLDQQAGDMAGYGADFPEILALHRELADRAVAQLAARIADRGVEPACQREATS